MPAELNTDNTGQVETGSTGNESVQNVNSAKQEHSDLSGNQDNEDDDEDDIDNQVDVGSEKKKKNQKKKQKKKKKASPASKQSNPPRIPVSKLFPNSNYPIGEEVPYSGENAFRTTSEEKRAIERANGEEDPSSPYNYNTVRKAAEIHRQVRHYAQRSIKPGQRLIDIVEGIEDSVRALAEADGIDGGIAFPTGVALNDCAAHYTPNPGDNRVLGTGDIMKVDIGVHVNGRIVDSAFTMNFEPSYQRLLDAVKAATNAGIREAGIDARMSEIGTAIQEVMESYEVEVNGKVIPVKTIQSLSGHSIGIHSIHGVKCVPIVKNNDETKMEEGEYYAIETFGSTGRGRVFDDFECSYFSKNPDVGHRPLKLKSAKNLLNSINKNFSTLPFCRRYLDHFGETKHLLALQNLVEAGIVDEHMPLFDIKGSMTAQYEHTIHLRPTCKEVVSRGPDY